MCDAVSIKTAQSRCFWTAEMDDALTTLVSGGSTMLTIAKQLGVTRSAVAGRMSRLRLQSVNAPSVDPNRPKRPKRDKAQPNLTSVSVNPREGATQTVTETYVETEAETSETSETAAPLPGLTLLDLKPNSCRAIVSERPTRFCGEPVLAGRSWCAHHRALYFQPAQPTLKKKNPVPIA